MISSSPVRARQVRPGSARGTYGTCGSRWGGCIHVPRKHARAGNASSARCVQEGRGRADCSRIGGQAPDDRGVHISCWHIGDQARVPAGHKIARRCNDAPARAAPLRERHRTLQYLNLPKPLSIPNNHRATKRSATPARVRLGDGLADHPYSHVDVAEYGACCTVPSRTGDACNRPSNKYAEGASGSSFLRCHGGGCLNHRALILLRGGAP